MRDDGCQDISAYLWLEGWCFGTGVVISSEKRIGRAANFFRDSLRDNREKRLMNSREKIELDFVLSCEGF